MRLAAFLTAVALGLAGPALADPPVASAGGSIPAAPQSSAPAPLPTEAASVTEHGDAVAMGPCGPEKVQADGKLDTRPHGEVEAGVGTGGYRHIGGAVCQPIGQDGAIAVRVDDTQFGRGYGRR